MLFSTLFNLIHSFHFTLLSVKLDNLLGRRVLEIEHIASLVYRHALGVNKLNQAQSHVIWHLKVVLLHSVLVILLLLLDRRRRLLFYGQLATLHD